MPASVMGEEKQTTVTRQKNMKRREEEKLHVLLWAAKAEAGPKRRGRGVAYLVASCVATGRGSHGCREGLAR